MRRFQLLLLFGCLLLTASVHRVMGMEDTEAEAEEEDEYEEIEGEDEVNEEKEGEVDDSDVVVLTDANFDEKIGAAKFALVSRRHQRRKISRTCVWCAGRILRTVVWTLQSEIFDDSLKRTNQHVC